MNQKKALITQTSLLFVAGLLLWMPASAQVVGIQADPMLLDAEFGPKDREHFQTPPKVFWPETWFHFLGDNVSEAGMEADLEAIRNAGISGIQWFHGNADGRWPGVDRPVKPLSPEWDEMVAYLARTARNLDLRLTIQTCPGWAMAGGPWIRPEDAMRDLVWSRTDVAAGSRVDLALPKGMPSGEDWRDYQDVCVLAFPTPEGDTGEPLVLQNIQSEEVSWAALLEGTGKVIEVEGGRHVVRFSPPEGAVIRTLELPSINSMNHPWVYVPGIHMRLDALQRDGSRQTILDVDLPMSSWQDGAPFVLAVEEREAPEMELTLTNAHPMELAYLRFYSAARKNDWQAEAARTLRAKEPFQAHVRQSQKAYVPVESVVDLSGQTDPDGRLQWAVPDGEGTWTVLRFGHVNSGRRNSPAPPEATGWECNKLDARGADQQFSHYVGRLQDGPLAGLAGGMLMDSWECSNQTWTGMMEDEFARRAGYALRQWMPALTGYVLDSPETTYRFLTDWRRTVTALYNECFFARMTELAHEKGLEVQYETAGGDVVAMDPLEYYKYADVPMCEFWQPLEENFVGSLNFKPVKPTASAAHIYGKRRVAAESFTSFQLTWDEHWEMFKEVANVNMTEGVTHNVFHTYTHNPQVGFLPPGTSFGGGIGTPFLRGQTWWKYMPEFTRYLARTGYLLERGLPVVDVLWYLGDEVGHRPDQLAAFPEGFKYDYCNPDVLLNRLKVKHGRLCTPDGQTYGMLWIPDSERMLPETVEKLYRLIRAGAKVVAGPPKGFATLHVDAKAEKRFTRRVRSIWRKQGVVRRLGRGRIAWGVPLEEAMEAFGMKPQLVAEGGTVQWTARAVKGACWFYVTAPPGGEFHGSLLLKARGTAELWDASTGEVTALESVQEGAYQRVRLDLGRAENRFVVFREKGDPQVRPAPVPEGKVESVGNWTLRFPEGWGAPEEPMRLSSLIPWKDLPISAEGRAFSGTATYETTLEVPENRIGKPVFLDLGDVDMIADVTVNGKSAGVRWAHPYRVPIGDLLQAGTNTVCVDVTGTWFNRLAYDASLPEAERKTWSINGPAAGSPLRDSGLLGPVQLIY